MGKQFMARRLDVMGFAEEGATLSSREPVQAYRRLLAETEGREAASPVVWSARGELRNPRHVQPEAWLHLHADTVLPLTCQRCLGTVQVPLHVERSFRFAADEDTAAAEDETSEEDVLALSRAFDLVELAEDELLLALPLVPRHVICPVAPLPARGDEDRDAGAGRRDNPFAVLGKFKPGKS